MAAHAMRGWAETQPLVKPAPSPLAKTLESEVIVFPGERLALLEDFVRLRVAAQYVNFVCVLEREGISPSYYAAMAARFDEMRRRDPRLDAAFKSRLGIALRR